MGMLKRVAVILVCIVLCATLTIGCKKENEIPSAQEITREILSCYDKDIVWTELGKDDLAAHFGFSAKGISSLSVAVSDDDESYDTVAAFVFDSTEELNGAIEKLNKSMSAAAETFKNIDVSEAEKIAQRVVYRNGNMLVISVSANHEKIVKLLTEKGFVSVAK